jgi:hypothetical protein
MRTDPQFEILGLEIAAADTPELQDRVIKKVRKALRKTRFSLGQILDDLGLERNGKQPKNKH